MAEETKKESKSSRRYGHSPKAPKKKGEKDGKPEAAPEKKADATAGSTEGSPGVVKTNDPGPAAGVDGGTDGIPVNEVHERERKDMHTRHEKERRDMHTRHEGEHKAMTARQTKELPKEHAEGSAAKSAGEKADKTEKPEGKGGTEPKK